MRGIDFSSWQGGLSTLAGLVLITLLGVGIRLLVMQTLQQRRERENRQINERLRTLMAAYKTLGGSFTGELGVDPTHLRDLRQRAHEEGIAEPGSDRARRIRDGVEAALSDILLLGTDEQVRLAARAASELAQGRAVHTHELVISLRDFVREALDLVPVPADLEIPRQGPTRPAGSGGGSGKGRNESEAKGGRIGGSGGGGGGMGAGMGGLGVGAGAALGAGHAAGEDEAGGRWGRPPGAALEFEDRFESAVDHPCTVERHGILRRVQPRVFHHFLHACIAGGLVRPLDPGKHHRFLRRGFHRAEEVGGFAMRHVIAPAFHHPQCSIFQEHHIGAAGVGEEFLLVGGGHRQYETIDVAHRLPPEWTVPGARPSLSRRFTVRQIDIGCRLFESKRVRVPRAYA